METTSKPVRVRFAPSPTGFLHIGGVRSALYNWLFARHHKGVFILRVEDTDRTRLVDGAIENLYQTLVKTGLTPDEGICVENGKVIDEGPHAPYLQSARKDKHLAYAQTLIEQDHAYYCFCSKERLEQIGEQQKALKQPMMYDRHCRSLSKEEVAQKLEANEAHVIRLKVPTEGLAICEDMIRGRVEIPWAQVDDQVLIKSDGFPTYHLAATCDDHDMEITHVIRGEEWLSSLPKHLFIFQAFGWEAPSYAHLPLLLNADRSKLSKRQGDVAAEDYLKKGYVPDALINFLALLGWNTTGDREIFTREELISAFDLTKVNKAGAIFNTEKLDWLNEQYIRAMADEAFLKMCVEQGWLKEGMDEKQMRAALIAKLRITTLQQVPESVQEFFDVPAPSAEALVWKKQTKEDAKEKLTALRSWINEREDSAFTVAELEIDVRAWVKEQGWDNGSVLWPLRVALSGRPTSPSPFELLYVYGKKESLQHIDEALTCLA